MLNIRKAKSNDPMRILIYGQEGVGKSTFGAKADSPIFISAEGGSGHLKTKTGENVDEFETIKTFKDVTDSIDALINENHAFKTLVIDSADWVEQLVHAQILDGSGKSMTTVNGGYNAGYREAEKIHMELVQKLNVLRVKKDMHAVIIAHTHIKKVSAPDVAEDYSMHEIKMHEYVSSIWKQWVDVVGFARFMTIVHGDDKKTPKRVLSDGSRLLYLEHEPSMEAKNRWSMPSPIDFTEDAYDVLKSYWIKNQDDGKGLEKEIKDLIKKIDDKELVKKVEANLEKFKGNAPKLEAVRQRLIAITKGE